MMGNLYLPRAMENHRKNLQNRCRVCGRKGKGYMHNKESEKCKAILLSANIAVDSDSTDIHPDSVCNSCYITLGQIRRAKESGNAPRDIDVHPWSPHTESCLLCSTVSEESVGGRPRKRGRPTSHKIKSFLRVINGLDLPSLFSECSLNLH